MRLAKLLTVAFGLALMMTVPASANLTGVTIQTNYLYPTLGDLYGTADVVVGPGVELNGWPPAEAVLIVDLSATNIYITANYNDHLSNQPFNGPHFYDLYDGAPSITNVSINPVTNLVGLDEPGRITWDADNIWVNFSNLIFVQETNEAYPYPPTIVSLDITFGEAVPEPATWMTLPAGLLGAAWAARRKRQRQ